MPVEARTLRTAEQSARGVRERFILRIDPSRSRVEDREHLGRSAEHWVDTQDSTVESMWKPFIVYQREVSHELLGEAPAVAIESHETGVPLALDYEAFWPKVAALAALDWSEAQSVLSDDATLQAFAARFHSEVAALAAAAPPSSPQLDDVFPGSDALLFWSAAVVFSGQDAHERVLRGEPVTLDEQTWADGELCLGIVDGALKDRFGDPNPSYEPTPQGAQVDYSAADYDQLPVARSVVGIWFVARLPSGALAECIGAFYDDVFVELAGQAQAAATWLASGLSAQIISPVEAFETHCYEPYDGLEIFTARRKWKGSLGDYLRERGLKQE